MNYYPHHIGDFNSATRHLTRVERSLYRDLTELYYDTESVLTDDLKLLERRVLCVNDEEKTALIYVLSEFFQKVDGGYFHERCDKEIIKYRKNTSLKAKAGIASAEARKKKRTGVEHVLSKRATNQEPITNNHKPIKDSATFLQAKKIAHYLSKKILSEKADAKLKPESWCKAIDLAIRIDGRTEIELVAVINWIYSGDGDFWISNIMSGVKLRKQFDQISMQMKAGKKIVKQKAMKLPMIDNELESWAIKNNLPKPSAGASYPEYRRQLQNLLENKQALK